MTSINNFENVEFEEEKKNRARELLNSIKFKKPGKFKFVLKKKYIAVASLVLMLCGAVYVNYLYSTGELDKLNPVGKNYGDSILVDGDLTDGELGDAASVFSEARVNRKQTREEAITTMQNLFGAEETDSEQASALSAKAETMAANMELETKIESMMKAKGFKDCVVYISEDYADVMVETEGLLETEAALIKDAIIQETSVPVENIKIIEVD